MEKNHTGARPGVITMVSGIQSFNRLKSAPFFEPKGRGLRVGWWVDGLMGWWRGYGEIVGGIAGGVRSEMAAGLCHE